jgi:hypothetical protein
MMEKDNSVKFGVTKCDYCDEPAVGTVDDVVVCERHLKPELIKDAGDGIPFKAVSIHLADQHKQK